MQGEAAYVRTGHHGRRIDGVEAGRFEDAREIPVAIFPQHTSRNGDPQLHVHVLWLNKVQTVRDGTWRAIDSRALHRNKGAGAALANAVAHALGPEVEITSLPVNLHRFCPLRASVSERAASVPTPPAHC